MFQSTQETVNSSVLFLTVILCQVIFTQNRTGKCHGFVDLS